MTTHTAGYKGAIACSVAGITYRQLDYWARTGLVVPSMREATGSGTLRQYSFQDVLVLKVVKRLLDTGVCIEFDCMDHERSQFRRKCVLLLFFLLS